MAEEAKPESLTLWDAIKDLGWFPTALALFVSGPSILAISETVFVDHQLVPALQWIVDGYNRVMAVLGAVVEPLIQPAIDWLNSRLNWSLTLDPVWRPLFALGMVFVFAVARSWWRREYRGEAVGVVIVVGFGALSGAVLAGVLPSDGGWWAQGLRAAVPVAILMLLFGLTEAVSELGRGSGNPGEVLRLGVGFVLFLGLLAFPIGAALSYMPGLSATAGFLTLGGIVAAIGVAALAFGRSTAGIRFGARFGLTILSGFVTAGLILGADWALKALGAG